ncbi:MAG: PTS lactose/cellobiose transporter subunit IIA [Lachnospiraceae bacterium]|nr:PTS lactose/cellobiose transporter subunit IIA [Lachnospiraceae bacterium]
MVNIEKMAECAMLMISYAGMAKSCYMEALQLTKQGKFTEADKKIEEGDKNFTEAHNGHHDLLQVEVTTGEPQICLLMTHAEDQLMSTETIKTIILELIEIYKERKVD